MISHGNEQLPPLGHVSIWSELQYKKWERLMTSGIPSYVQWAHARILDRQRPALLFYLCVCGCGQVNKPLRLQIVHFEMVSGVLACCMQILSTSPASQAFFLIFGRPGRKSTQGVLVLWNHPAAFTSGMHNCAVPSVRLAACT